MTDEEEFEARSLLKWQRVNALEWVLLYRRKKMGRVISDQDYPGMYRSILPDGSLSDMANLSWSKDAVLAQAVREVAYDLSCKRPLNSLGNKGGKSGDLAPHSLKPAAP